MAIRHSDVVEVVSVLASSHLLVGALLIVVCLVVGLLAYMTSKGAFEVKIYKGNRG